MTILASAVLRKIKSINNSILLLCSRGRRADAAGHWARDGGGGRGGGGGGGGRGDGPPRRDDFDRRDRDRGGDRGGDRCVQLFVFAVVSLTIVDPIGVHLD